MIRDHYDQRRRQLDAELRAGIDLLFRALQDLGAKGYIAILQGGEGRKPTRYRRLQL